MSLASLADRALDLTVAPGYSRFGYALRSRGWDELPRMDGRVDPGWVDTPGLHTLHVLARIYGQAFRLKLRGVSVRPHPSVDAS